MPAGLTSGLTGFDEQILNELRSLHFIDLQDTDAKELLGQIFDILLVHLVLVDDAQDEPTLTLCAVPDNVAAIFRDAGAVDVLLGMTVSRILGTIAGARDEASVLNFLVHGLLEKLVKPLTFRLDLGQIGEFDFDGDAEAVAAEFRQSELLAVVGAEFDSHGGVVVTVDGHKKNQALMAWLVCALLGFCWGLCRLRWHSDGFFRNSEVRCLGPSC